MTFQEYKDKLAQTVKLRIEIEDLLVGWREYILSNQSFDFISNIIVKEFGGIRLSEYNFRIYKTYIKVYNENNFVKIEKSTCK